MSTERYYFVHFKKSKSSPKKCTPRVDTDNMDILRPLLNRRSRPKKDFVTFNEAFQCFSTKLDVGEQSLTKIDDRDKQYLLYMYLVKVIFQGAVAIGISECEDRMSGTNSDDFVSTFSMKHDYKRLVASLKNDLKNAPLDALVLILRSGCSDKFNNPLTLPQKCNFCPGYHILIDYGVIHEKDGYYLLKFHEEFSCFHVTHDFSKIFTNPDIKIINCSCKRISNYFRVQKCDSHFIAFHANARGNTIGHPLNSYFVEYAHKFIANYCTFIENFSEKLFILFLFAHGATIKGAKSAHKNSFTVNAFGEDSSIKKKMLEAMDFICDKIFIEKESLEKKLEIFSNKTLLEYQKNAILPFLSKDNFSTLCYNAIQAWELFSPENITNEEVLCKKMMLAWCEGKSQKELYEDFHEESIKKYSNHISFVEAYLKTRVKKIRKQYSQYNLPETPVKGRKQNNVK